MRKILSGAFTVALLAVFLFLLFVVLTRSQTPTSAIASRAAATQRDFLLRKYVVRFG